MEPFSFSLFSPKDLDQFSFRTLVGCLAWDDILQNCSYDQHVPARYVVTTYMRLVEQDTVKHFVITASQFV
jgi:hypothetical protein